MRSGWGSVWALVSALGGVAFVACDDDDNHKPLYCYEYVPGESVNPDIGGSPAGLAMVQAVADYAATARTATLRLTVLCTEIAKDHGADDAAIAQALTDRMERAERASKACRLAADRIIATRATKPPAPLPTGTCLSLTAFEAACVKRSGPASALACALSAKARAECLASPVERAHFAELLALQAHLELMAESSGTFTSAVSAVTDIKAACIPVVVAGIGATASSLAQSLFSASQVVATAEGMERDQ